jgi:ribosome-associated toxin RatA of RatAB toxin-antitoxin module
MCFSDDELKQAIAKAKELAVQMQENIKDFEKAEKLKKVVSNSKLLPATPEADELYATIMNFKEVVSSCKEVLAMYQDYIREAIAKGVDVRAKANLQIRAGAKKFDPKLFESKYPDLYRKYSISTASITGAFRAKQDKNWSFDISTLEPEQVELLADFKKQLKIADHTMETGFVLHSKHLGALEIEKYAEWESQMANTKLRVLTGEAEGIEGICTWKRELKETISLDKDKLKAEQPNEYNDCMVQGAETEALVIHPKIAQAE